MHWKAIKRIEISLGLGKLLSTQCQARRLSGKLCSTLHTTITPITSLTIPGNVNDELPRTAKWTGLLEAESFNVNRMSYWLNSMSPLWEGSPTKLDQLLA